MTTERRPYAFPDCLDGRSDKERSLLLAAKDKHDADGCTCDPKYVFICQRFQQAIREVTS